MWFSVVSSLICFAIATILFTQPFRECRFYKELSIFFLFEGSWAIIDLAASEIWPKNNFMSWVNYIGTIIFGGYLLYNLIVIYNRGAGDDKHSKCKKNIKTENK